MEGFTKYVYTLWSNLSRHLRLNKSYIEGPTSSLYHSEMIPGSLRAPSVSSRISYYLLWESFLTDVENWDEENRSMSVCPTKQYDVCVDLTWPSV